MAERKFDFNKVRKQMEKMKKKSKRKGAVGAITPNETKSELARLKKIQKQKRQEEENLRLFKRVEKDKLSLNDVLKELKKKDPNATTLDAMKIMRGPVESAKLKGKDELGGLAKQILSHTPSAKEKTTTVKASGKISRAFKHLTKQLDIADERMHTRNERISLARQRQKLQLEMDKLDLAEKKAALTRKTQRLIELEKRRASLEKLAKEIELPSEKAKRQMETADIMLKYNANTPEEALLRQKQEEEEKTLINKKEFYEKKARLTGKKKILTGTIEARTEYYTTKDGQQRKGIIYVSPGGTKIDEGNLLHKKIESLNDISFRVKQTNRTIKLKRRLTENPATGDINVIATIENPATIHPKSLETLAKNAKAAGLKVIKKKGRIEIVG